MKSHANYFPLLQPVFLFLSQPGFSVLQRQPHFISFPGLEKKKQGWCRVIGRRVAMATVWPCAIGRAVFLSLAGDEVLNRASR